MSFIKILDPKIKTENLKDMNYIVKEGGRVSYVVIPPQNTLGASPSNYTYQLNNVGPNTARDRRLWVHLVGSVVITGTNFAATSDNDIGFKPWPVNRNVQSVTHTLNSATETFSTYQYIDWLIRMKFKPDDMSFFDNSAPDVHTNYSTDADSNSSPIVDYTNTPEGYILRPRTVGLTSIVRNSATQITVNFDLWEPLITPFSAVNPCDLPALFAIDGENIQINWFNGCSDLLAINVDGLGDDATVTGTVTTVNTAGLYVRYITAPNLIIPESSVYQFPKFQQFVQNAVSPLGPGGSGSSTVQINSQTVPSKVVLFVRQQEITRTYATPDWYAQISSVQIQFNNGNYIFNGASLRNLFDVSRQNGLCMSYPLFSQQPLNSSVGTPATVYGCGSVLVIDPALDLSISPDELTNCSAGKYTMQVIVNYLNNTSADTITNGQLYAWIINDALLIRNGRKYGTQYLAYTREQVREANHLGTAMDQLEYEDAQLANMFLSGGGFKSFFKKIHEGAKKVHGLAKQAHGFYKEHEGAIKQGIAYAKQARSAMSGKGLDELGVYYE